MFIYFVLQSKSIFLIFFFFLSWIISFLFIWFHSFQSGMWQEGTKRLFIFAPLIFLYLMLCFFSVLSEIKVRLWEQEDSSLQCHR